MLREEKKTADYQNIFYDFFPIVTKKNHDFWNLNTRKTNDIYHTVISSRKFRDQCIPKLVAKFHSSAFVCCKAFKSTSWQNGIRSVN